MFWKNYDIWHDCYALETSKETYKIESKLQNIYRIENGLNINPLSFLFRNVS